MIYLEYYLIYSPVLLLLFSNIFDAHSPYNIHNEGLELTIQKTTNITIDILNDVIVFEKPNKYSNPNFCGIYLENGMVYYGDCNSLESKFLQEIKYKVHHAFSNGIFVYKYLPNIHIKNTNSDEHILKRSIVHSLVFTKTGNPEQVKQVIIEKFNPYKKINIDIDQYYDSELESIENHQLDVAEFYSSYFSPFIIYDSYTVVSYNLYGYKHGSIVENSEYFILINECGDIIYSKNTNQNTIPKTLSHDEKFLVALNNRSTSMLRSGQPRSIQSISIIDIQSQKEIYKDECINLNYVIEGPSTTSEGLIFYIKQPLNLSLGKQEYILIDVDNKILFSRKLSNSEIQDISIGSISWATDWASIFEKYPFKKGKF